MKFSKLICVITAALMICAACLGGCAVGNLPETGECGEDAAWTLTDGVLTVEGTGAVTEQIAPEGSVKEIVVSEGITELGAKVFKDIPGIESIKLPDSLSKIGREAFSGLTDVDEIKIPDSVKDIADDAFRNWKDSQQILSEWYEGAADDWQRYYDLWKNYGDTLKAFIDEEGLREKLQNFVNKWAGYIKENFNEILSSVESIKDTGEEAAIEAIGDLGQYNEEFVNDILALIPSIDEVLNKMETEGKGIIFEIKGDIGKDLEGLHNALSDIEEIFGESKEEVFDLFKSLVPEYERGLKEILGIGDGEETEESGEQEEDTETKDGEKSDWLKFIGGIDPDALEIILSAVASR